jgi:ketosteroid isomerase-like protein
MRKSVIIFFVGFALLLCFASAPAFAQQWNAEQKEVWGAIENVWEAFAQNDLQKVLTFFHPDYVGWHYGAQFPSNLETGKKWMEHFLPKREMILYDLKPMVINVHGNTAVVYYLYTEVSKTEKGDEKVSSGRWVETWVKEGNKWQVIGDHGGTTSE